MPNGYPARNMLAGQSSPYLIQHAENPVHWRPWGEDALREAAQTGKPILLSVGYAACHWCHVMAHESFENPEIAALMNQLYVNVKVDREERPDVDQIYMAALHAMGEQGGWPLTMFLAPDGRPFWGGTYFPPDSRYGRPGFPQVLKAIEKAWREDRDNVERNAAALNDHLQALSKPPDGVHPPTGAVFDTLATRLLQLSDPVHGGLRGAPKFPNAPMTEIWLRAVDGNPDSEQATAFLHAMTAMCQGGIYDHIGGGLARYSTDEKWLVPHFEKMLYDNAHFIRLLARAYQLRPDDLFRVRIEETIAWLVREMRQPGGAFASSLDADSEGEEGRFYVWTVKEIDDVLGADAELFKKAYGVTQAGNFPESNLPGANVLSLPTGLQSNSEEEASLAASREALLAIRNKRIRPGIDDKILADWNGYMIRALAEAGFVFKRDDWIDLADGAFRFICESMSEDHELSHAWRDGVHVRPGLATDYGAMANAAISLHQVKGMYSYLESAGEWMAILQRDYADGHGGYYLTSKSAGDIAIRPRADSDEANPSGASQILEAMTRLARITGDAERLDDAHRLAGSLHAAAVNSGHGSAGFANALDTLLNGRHAKLFVDKPEDAEPWLDLLRQTPDPSITWQIVTGGESSTHMGIELTPPAKRPAAILCSDGACSAPLTDPEALADALKNS